MESTAHVGVFLLRGICPLMGAEPRSRLWISIFACRCHDNNSTSRLHTQKLSPAPQVSYSHGRFPIYILRSSSLHRL